MNTVSPYSVVNAVIKARKDLEKKDTEEEPIILTEEMQNLFQDFVSIQSNQRVGGLRLA